MIHQLVSDQLTVTVNSKGAELSSIKNSEGIEYLWNGRPDLWPRQAPVLFPIVGKLKNNGYAYRKKEYSLGQHGFARDLEFHLAGGDQGSCTFELQDSIETKKSYPFAFRLQLSYELKGDTLTCSYKIKNPSTDELLFSIGAHPGFNCPLTANETFDDYYLEFEKNSYVQTTLSEGLRSGEKRLIIEDKKLFLSEDVFENDALVFEHNQINKIALRSSRSSRHITLTCEGWPYFGIWAKKGSSEFVCLEPWYGIADALTAGPQFSEKAGIISLAGQNEFDCHFSIQLG